MSNTAAVRRKKTSPSTNMEACAIISDLVEKVAGISIPTQKYFLIEGRLEKRWQTLRLKSLLDYANRVVSDRKELVICIEFLTTHKTEWFREIAHFHWLKTALPQLKSQTEKLYIWSAASSTGEEAYSVLFFLLRLGFNHAQFGILGTDISRPVLEKAMRCPESASFRLQTQFLFNHTANKESLEREFSLALAHSIKFRHHNLMDESKIFPVKFDVIFLRNVLIYFEKEVAIQVCRNLLRQLRPGGYLVIGLTESIKGELPQLVYLGNSVYRYQPGKQS